MPFTPTHIVAILPIAGIKRFPLPFSALAIGSMIPDFPLFVAISPSYSTTHSIPGVITACLPLGLGCFLVFHVLMKRPLFALLPTAIQGRCRRIATRPIEPTLRFFAGASAAIVVGACSHVFWDSFTHRGRWGTQIFPHLNETALTIGDYAMAGAEVFQHGSTLVGLPLLLLFLTIWFLRQEPRSLDDQPTLSPTTKVAANLVTIAVPLSVGLMVWQERGVPKINRLFHSITASGFALILIVLAYCLLFRAIERRSPNPS
jgi:uncharacterized membrane protein (DUF485 family)